MKKISKLLGVLVGLSMLFAAQLAFAHVVVNPKSVGIGVRQIFTVSVPNEKEVPTIGIRLLIPDGLKSVTPNVKPGWKIEIKKEPTGKKITNEDGEEVDEVLPKEIIWTGGAIPQDQRDEFSFQTQAATTETKLTWKAYQTYQDGTVVAWDQTPGNDAKTPYSVTAVVNDLNSGTAKPSWWQTNQINVTLGVSLFALVMSLAILLKNDGKQKV